LTFAPGDVEGVVHVAVRGDRVVEPDEALSVGLSDPSNATLGDASAPLTIEDDEPFALAVTSPSVTEGNSGTTPATFTVALDGAAPAGSSVSVDYHAAGVTATVPGDVAPARYTGRPRTSRGSRGADPARLRSSPAPRSTGAMRRGSAAETRCNGGHHGTR
jgi:hypothetical protein